MRGGILELCLGLELFRQPLVVGHLGAGLAAQQFLGAVELQLGVGQGGFCGIALGDLLGDRGLVRFGFDGEQDLAFLDRVAIVELARPEEALDPGPQLDLVDRGGTTDELGLVGDWRQLGRLDQNGGRGGTLLGFCRAARKRRHQAGSEKRQYPQTPLLHCHFPCSPITSGHCLNSTKRSL